MTSFLREARGNGSVIVILVIVVVFSVFLAGGSGSLLSGADPKPEPSITTTPVITAPSPTQTALQPIPTVSTPPSVNSWSIGINLEPCKRINNIPTRQGSIVLAGLSNGYATLEISNGGAYREIDSEKFTAPQSFLQADLRNTQAFNSSNWRVKLYSGGSLTGTSWSGGAEQTVANGQPTLCQ